MIFARSRRQAPPWRRLLRTVNQERAPLVYRILVRVARLFIPLVAERHWYGQQNIPQQGGVLVVANHIGNFDPVVLGEYLIYSGRWPRFLGKDAIFKTPILGWVARQCRQIPVLRGTPSAKESLVHATQALGVGDLVAMYPEGTITRDPLGWPMTALPGAARLALTTGATVIPIGQVGAERVLGGRKLDFSALLSSRRRPISIMAGAPLDLSEFTSGAEPTKEELHRASVRIMDTITGLVSQLLGETPPPGRYDRRVGDRVPQDAD